MILGQIITFFRQKPLVNVLVTGKSIDCVIFILS